MRIAAAVVMALERTPPERGADIMTQGIVRPGAVRIYKTYVEQAFRQVRESGYRLALDIHGMELDQQLNPDAEPGITRFGRTDAPGDKVIYPRNNDENV